MCLVRWIMGRIGKVGRVKMKLAWLSRSMILPLGTFPWLSLSVIHAKTSLKGLILIILSTCSRLSRNTSYSLHSFRICLSLLRGLGCSSTVQQSLLSSDRSRLSKWHDSWVECSHYTDVQWPLTSCDWSWCKPVCSASWCAYFCAPPLMIATTHFESYTADVDDTGLWWHKRLLWPFWSEGFPS
jgi:hypothetical protein